jgi:hypothetical protein
LEEEGWFLWNLSIFGNFGIREPFSFFKSFITIRPWLYNKVLIDKILFKYKYSFFTLNGEHSGQLYTIYPDIIISRYIFCSGIVAVLRNVIAGWLQGVIAGHYSRVIAGRYCGDVIAGHYFCYRGALFLRVITVWCYCGAARYCGMY